MKNMYYLEEDCDLEYEYDDEETILDDMFPDRHDPNWSDEDDGCGPFMG